MKKLGKKLNKFMKLFLAFGLLFNNLTSLSIVFADEITGEDTEIKENIDDEKVTTTEEKIKDTENNTDEKTDATEEKTENTDAVEETTGENEEITTEEGTHTEEVTNEVSFAYEVYADDAKFEDDYGWVELDKSVQKLDIMAKLSGVEATEDYKYVFEGNEYTAKELLNGVVIKSLTFDGYLYGIFELEITGTLTDPEGNTTPYEMTYGIGHGTDTDNDEALSAVNNDYVFASGVLTTTNYDEEILNAIVKEAFPNASVEINGSDLSLEDSHGAYAWYGIVTKGDVNGDGKIDQDDLDLLISQVLGLEETTENSDVNGDGEVNDLDAAYLKLMLETGYTENISEDEATIKAKFGEFTGPVKVGDEFTLDYMVTLSEYTINGISGLVKYDKNLLDLVSAEAKVFNLGDMNEDKFLYLGEYLDLDIEPVEDENGDMLFNEDGSPKLIFNDVDYVLITLTFKALAAGEANVSMDEVKYYDFDVYYTPEGDTNIDVIIEDEEENPFESITVAGYNVDLSTYEVTVPNDVKASDLEYVLANDNYNVLVDAPEELAEGENTIVITLTDLEGNEKTYTIKVTREAAPVEETVTETVTPVTYQEYNTDNREPEVIVTPGDEEDDNKKADETTEEKANNVSRIVIIILILLAIAGLIYLIFKDDDDEETKKANKEIDKLKKEDNKKVHNKKTNNDKKVKKKGR